MMPFMKPPAAVSTIRSGKAIAMTERKPLTSVGYAVPPKTSQFKKGQSGNPKGRRKGSVALSTLIRKSAKERVIVQENGTRKSMTKDEAALKQLFNKAASGDQRAIKLMADLMNLHTAGAEPATPRFTLTDADREVLAQMIDRARRQGDPDNNAQ
jgi:hypothetical protein